MTAHAAWPLGTGRLDRSGGLRDNKPAGGTDTAGDLKGREFAARGFSIYLSPERWG